MPPSKKVRVFLQSTTLYIKIFLYIILGYISQKSYIILIYYFLRNISIVFLIFYFYFQIFFCFIIISFKNKWLFV